MPACATCGRQTANRAFCSKGCAGASYRKDKRDAEIYARHRGGASVKQLATDHSISSARIYQIIDKRSRLLHWVAI